MSLKSFLKSRLQQKGFLTYKELLDICENVNGELKQRYKIETCSRRLREMPEVKSYDKNGNEVKDSRAIEVYRWEGEVRKQIGNYKVVGEDKEIPIFNL